jgi:hypothetical protein
MALSEQCIDERRYGTASTEYNQETKQEKDNDDGSEPEFFPLFHKLP